ncbi:MAG TPA: carbohydrate kinase family protein [Patescibacteria group bacterium]|nr:carbohydrate kinase family protein [Patescibacteria group bacterium]
MLDILTIGDIKLDTFVVLDEGSVQCQLKMPECQLCLEYGAKIPVRVVDSQIAGTAPNVAVGLSRMGFKTAVVSLMGKDGTRHLALQRFKEEGVSSKFVRITPHEPSAYSVVINFQGEKTILTSHVGKAYSFPAQPPQTKWIYVGEMGTGYERLFRSLTSHAKDRPVSIGFNPGSIQIREQKPVFFALLHQVRVLFVNLEEAHAIVGDSSLEIHHLATSLWKLGPQTVVITDGKNGSYSFDGSDLHRCPVFPTRVIESTGAGDAFATGFVSALLSGEAHHEALRWGAVNAASVVSKIGPQAGLLSLNQIRNRLRQSKSFHAIHI